MGTIEVRNQLDEKFAALDGLSKLTITFLSFAQCSAGYKRFLALNQMNHATVFLRSDESDEAAAEAGEEVVINAIPRLRELVETALADPPSSTDRDFLPQDEALTRSYLWTNAFEEPIYYDIRHVARDGLRALEARARAMAPPPGAPAPAA